MRYLEINQTRQTHADVKRPIGKSQQFDRHGRKLPAPVWKLKPQKNSIGLNLIQRDRLLRIAEIMSILEFAPSLNDFAELFLGISDDQLSDYLAGRTGNLPVKTMRRLRYKLEISHDTCADEIAKASDKYELWAAQVRYNLIQTAFVHLDEIDKKLA